MKLKDIIIIEDELQPKIHRNYNDYIESDIPDNSIELDSSGRIISNKLSVLNFVDFLLSEYDFLPENNNEFNNDSHKLKKNKSKKKNRNNISSNGLSLKQKKKKLKNMDHFLNSKSNYPI